MSPSNIYPAQGAKQGRETSHLLTMQESFLAESFWLRLLDSLTVTVLGSKSVPRCVFCLGETSLWCSKGLVCLDGVDLGTVLKS